MQRGIPRGGRRPPTSVRRFGSAPGSALLLLLIAALVYALRPGLVVPGAAAGPWFPDSAGDWLQSRIRRLPLTGGAAAIPGAAAPHVRVPAAASAAAGRCRS